MTFSLVGCCRRTGQLGVAVASPEIGIGARVPWVRSGTGAVAVQNVADPRLGHEVLDLLQSGLDAQSTLSLLMSGRSDGEYRQILLVDSDGSPASFQGKALKPTYGVTVGEQAIAGGCGLPTPAISEAMVRSFEEAADGDLGERLVTGLLAGVAEGGEDLTVHSAALIVAADQSWPLIDLRVDWHESLSVQILEGLWLAYRAQADDYVRAALDPGGVSGLDSWNES